jgi:hypothetical protein
MRKPRQPISGGFRSADGAKDVAVMRPVLSAARKQGRTIRATLTGDPARLIASLRPVWRVPTPWRLCCGRQSRGQPAVARQGDRALPMCRSLPELE